MDALDFIVDRDQHMRPLEYDLSENFNELLRYMQDIGVLGNVPTGVTSESEIVSISDAYAAPPMALTVEGASEQDGTPTPDAPVAIESVCNINLLDESTFINGYYISQSGIVTSNAPSRYSSLVAVESGLTYCLSAVTTEAGGNKRVHGYDENGDWVSQLDARSSVPSDTNYSLVFDIPTGVTQIRVSIFVSDTSVKLELGNHVTPYVPYGEVDASLLMGEVIDLSDTSRWMTSLYSKPQPFISDPNYAIISYANGRVSMLRYSPVYALAILIGKLEVGRTYTLYVGDFATVRYSIARASALDGTVTQTLVNDACNMGYISFDVTTTDYYFIVSWVSSNTTLYFEDVRLVSSIARLPIGTSLRSLPDGTKDQLNLSYLRPSTREGWAWYSRELTQRTESYDLGDLEWVFRNETLYPHVFRTDLPDRDYAENTTMCSAYSHVSNIGLISDGKCFASFSTTYFYIENDDYDTVAECKEGLEGVELVVKLATPVITQLDPIELPFLPAPTATVWCDGGSVQPTLVLEYVRDANAVVAELSEAIADIISG